jgi:hypothetical protein
VFFAQALLVALALAGGDRPDPAGLEVGDGRSDGSTGPPLAAHSDRSKNPLACGANVLYLMLRMHGRPVTFREVEAAVRVGPEGTSLLELRDAAGRFGLPTRVRWCTINDLDRCPLPMIAHFKPIPGPAGQATAPLDQSLGGTGHFVLVLEVTADRGKFIDGTHGRIEEFQRERFPGFWSGYILEVVPWTPAWWPWLVAATVAGWVCFGLAVYLRGLRVRRAARARPELVAAVVFIILGGAGSANGGTTEAGGEGIWRRPDHDGVNCLYLQLKALGWPVRFETLENQLRRGRDHEPNNLLDLKRAAQDCGARLVIRSCGPRELGALPMPAIVLFEEVRGQKEFALLFRLDRRGCGIVEGSTASLTEMPIDDFRRRWSGLALVPDPTPRPGTKEVAIGLVAIGAYWFFRIRRPAGHRGSVPSPQTDPRDRPLDQPAAVS